jgi:hypothetical protein
MAWFKRSLRFKILATILAVALTLGLAANLSAQVPTNQQPGSLSNKLPNKWEFSPPSGPGEPVPVNRQGGASRGPKECLLENTELTALVPGIGEIPGIGQTASEYPTFVWHMPKSSALEVEFVLRDAKDRDIYSTKYTLANSAQGSVQGSSGIMSLSVPAFANVSPLEVGQHYYWSLALICDPIDRSSDVLAGGGIKRVKLDPTLAQNIQKATPEERVALYANAGVWYETVATLAELQRTRPNDTEIAQAWNKLLNSIGLDTSFRKAKK